MLDMTRRKLLGSLGSAIALSACAGHRGQLITQRSVLLGWRFVPGDTYTYRTVFSRTIGETTYARIEEWSYVVRGLDRDGIATLAGRLTGFGAEVLVDDESLPESVIQAPLASERDRAAIGVTLRITMDGRLISCSENDFARALPHRLLALRVPVFPVLPTDEWPDPGLANSFAGLLPFNIETELDGSAQLMRVLSKRSMLKAAIESRGSIRVGGNPAVVLGGTATWNASAGALVRRQVDAWFLPSTLDSNDNPGLLQLTTTLV